MDIICLDRPILQVWAIESFVITTNYTLESSLTLKNSRIILTQINIKFNHLTGVFQSDDWTLAENMASSRSSFQRWK